MHKIVKVETGFSEYNKPNDEYNRANDKTFNTIAEANEAFRRWACQIELDYRLKKEEKLGYFKTDFTITWDNGNQYKGRFDIGADASTLSGHLRNHCQTYSGRVKPSWMPEGDWESFKNIIMDPARNRQRDFLSDLLDNYQLE